jgi:dephospho-CoA kinase
MKKPRIIGLTGGIGMGKSTAAAILKNMGLPVYNADHAVHALLRKSGGAVKPVAQLFPESLKRGAIDRKILAKTIFHEPQKLKKLEAILHPLVRQEEKKFIAQAVKKKNLAVVLEIPLMFETGAHRRCDFVICVTAPLALQKRRVLERMHMTLERFKAIVKLQMPNTEKLKRADYVVRTGKSVEDTKKQLILILSDQKLV